MGKRTKWLMWIIISMLIFAGNALAAPAFSVSNVSGYWDKKGTPADFSDDKITVQFDAYPSGWTLHSTSVWISTGYSWNCLYDSSRGDFLLQNPYGNHWVMVADKVGFGGFGGNLGNVVEPAGFYIGYWDGISSNYFAITADGHLYDQQGIALSPTWPFTSSSPCTITVPDDYSTIQGAINAASAGCEIIVKDGTYVENIDFLGKAINVHSVNGAAATIIDGNQLDSVVKFSTSEGSASKLDGFTLRNGSGWSAGGIYCSFSSPAITNCIIKNNHAEQAGGGISCWNSSSPSIENCIITSNSSSNYGGGICALWGGSSPKIVNCVITKNTAQNICGGGVDLYNASASIVNCTISDNQAASGGGGLCLGNASATVVNSILWNNKAGGTSSEIYLDTYYAPNYIDITYSDIQNGYSGTGNISSNPKFVNSAAGNYHLAGGSPCIDTGNPVSAPPAFPVDDIDGDDRPQGARYDMGADEYVAPALAVDIMLNQSSFIPTQTLQAWAHITNDATPDTVKAKLFVTLPNGNKIVLRTINSCYIPANANMNVLAYSYTFKGSEPVGTYQFTGQLLDIATSAVLSEDTESFIFAK